MGSLTVTVPGSTGQNPVTLSSSADQSSWLAQSLGNLLNSTTAPPGGSGITVTTTTGTIPPVPTTGGTQVLDLAGASINAAIANNTYPIVYDTSSVPGTISGSNIAIFSGDGGGLFNVSGNSTVAATGGNNTITAIGTFSIGTGRGDNVVYATGSGTVQTGTVAGAGQPPEHSVVVVNATTPGGVAVQSGGSDEIVAYAGPVTVTAVGSDTSILGGPSGSITTNILGAASNVTVSAGGTNLAATVYGSNALIFGGSGTTNVDLGSGGGNQATIAGGSGAETVDASGGNIGVGKGPLLFDGTGTVNFVGGAGTATIVGGTVSGTTHVTVGAGGLLFSTGDDNSSTITSGSDKGLSTVFVGSGSSVVFGSTGSTPLGAVIFSAGAGNETLNAGGSASDNTMYAGSGNEALWGGTGNNSFDFYASRTGGATDVVKDFQTSDSINLIGYGVDASVTSGTGAGAVATLGDGTTITFSNVTDLAALNASIHNIA